MIKWFKKVATFIKSIWAILKAIDKIDPFSVQEKNIKLENLIRTHKNKIENLEKENKKLRRRLELKESVVFEYDACWKKDKEGNIEGGPYCSKCYDSEGKLMNLVSCGNAIYSECPICKKPLRIKYGKPWKPREIKIEGTPFDDKF